MEFLVGEDQDVEAEDTEAEAAKGTYFSINKNFQSRSFLFAEFNYKY